MEPSSHNEIDEINVGSSSNSQNSKVRNGILKRNQLSENSFTESCTLLEDIELPSSFESSSEAVEKFLSISDESPQNLKVYDSDLSECCSDNLTPITLASTDTKILFEDCQKIVETLESDKLIFDKESKPSIFSKLTILDIDNLNDSLLDDLSKYYCGENEGQDDGPSVSTPKNIEKIKEKYHNHENDEGINESTVIEGCKATLNFNGTFDKDPSLQKEILAINSESEIILGERNSKKERKVCNTTFDKPASEAVISPIMDLTYEAGSPKKDDEPLNRTFEVVGNGSFIIDGECTNLMDMESNALDTVLGSNPGTPLSRGVKSYPDTKKRRSSTIKKRHSGLNYQVKEDMTLTPKEKNNKLTSVTDNQDGNSEKTLPSLSSVDSQITKNNKLTKEQILSRLRKNNHPGSSTGVSGPMKAVPIASVKQIEEIQKRMTSTPDRLVDDVQRGAVNETSTSGEKENKKSSLPSFGSFSSIGTDGPVIKDHSSEDFMNTPEVFRHRNKSMGPHITSTPTLFPSTLKFDADLGLGSAPTPITAPRVEAAKNINIGKNLSDSYVCKTKKGNQAFETRRSEDESPDSARMGIESLEKAENGEGQAEIVSVSKVISPSPDGVQSESNTLLIKEEEKSNISPQKSDTFVNDLKNISVPDAVKEEMSEKLNSAQVACSEVKDTSDGPMLTSTAKDVIEVPKKSFSVYLSKAEVEFEKLNEAAGCRKHKVSPIGELPLNSVDGANILLTEEKINSGKNSGETLSSADEMIAAYEKLSQEDIQNFTNESKSESSTAEESLKLEKNSSYANKVDNSLLNKTLKSKKDIAKNSLRTSLSKNTNLANKVMNASNKITPKPSSTSKRLSYKPSIKVDKKPPPTITRPDSSRASIASYGSSRPVRPALKPINSTESNQSFKEPVLKQGLKCKEKPQLRKTILKAKVPMNPRILATPVSVNPSTLTTPVSANDKTLPASVSANVKTLPTLVSANAKTLPAVVSVNATTFPTPVPTNARTLKTPVPMNARTLPTPKAINNLPKSDKSKTTSDKLRSNIPNSRLPKFSSNKENDAPKSYHPRKSVVASGIRPPSTRTSIPVPRSLNMR